MRDLKEETLLIVDDEEINRAILANIFESEYNIMEAEDGQQALEVIETDPAALSAVLLDVVMPRVSGIELLRQMSRQGLTEKSRFFWLHRTLAVLPCGMPMSWA